MEKILISACLAGDRVRYDGRLAPLDHPLIREWKKQGRLVRFCPEMEGGLPMPRPPAEILRGPGAGGLDGKIRIKTVQGEDVTRAFIKGAELALALILRKNISVALLKDKSPSCGSSRVYDGKFRGRLIPGMGTTSALLDRFGVRVFSETQLEALNLFLKSG
ncbi:DUF523 domain-containing protein [Desulfospira joergensenii]|uniref:DUF523 domain-containing protein n=1 Tax=Desulfospira joergensenii TaxID=53329 RepID=UPI0003B50782|nr:DUF523 domain-containing protein [Desulfospira joergensenii]